MQSDNPNPSNESPPHNETQTKDDVQPSIWKFWTQRRYIVTFMLMLGCAIMFTLRINLSVAIISMTSNITDENGNVTSEADFDWNSKEQGIVLSSFFYGSILTILPGGILSKRFNGAHLYGSAIGIASLLTLLTPFAAQHLHTMIAIRVVQGLFLGITFPTQMALISKWAPVNERARITMLINSELKALNENESKSENRCQNESNHKVWMFWTQRRYILVVMLMLACTVMFTLRINLSVAIIPMTRNSVPFWALICAHFAHFWLAFTSMTYLPKFFSDIMKVKTSQTGFFSGLPYLINGIASNFAGVVADKLLSKGYFNVVQTRKLFTCVSFFIQSTLLLCLTFYMTPVMSFIIMTTVLTCSAFAMTGFWVNFIDIAPQFTGILFALSNTIAAISGIIAPTLTGFIVQNGEVNEWKLVFRISACILITGAILYGIGAQGHVQPWAVIPVKDEKKNEIELQEENEADLNNRQNPNNINIYSTSSKTDILN
uniref:CSON014451 protein n=1 Tax=Culicoides sonorensis TaxID=179676 RepID=A0A336KST6_CULSO